MSGLCGSSPQDVSGWVCWIVKLVVLWSTAHRSSFREPVRPAKAGVFSGRQSHRGNSQEPRSLGCIRGGNEANEANRQSHPWDGERVTGPQRE